jgi:hypothetical protein
MHLEKRFGTVETWFPQDIDLSYDFTSNVIELKPGGVEVVHYQRPTMTQTTSESLEGEGGTEKTDVKLNYNVTLSPINEILGAKNLSISNRLFAGTASQQGNDQFASITSFISEVYMLARNLGNLDSALDFAPKLPVNEVKPGDSWKHTVGYSPQQLADQPGKSAVQRLDYTYGFGGVITVEGKQVYRVTADLDMSTNLATFYFQTSGENPNTSILHAMPVRLKTHIDFDLDMKTCETIKAVSDSTGSIAVFFSASPTQATFDQRFHATTTMLLKSRK